jgi:monofunctional biosynthetic peptidoglycan transglycosylase
MAAKHETFLKRTWRFIKRLFIILFLLQLIYLLVLKWVDPPITVTQLGSFFSGNGLKRDYVDYKEMSVYAKLAVIASEDQLFPDHNGFDFKSIEKAMKHNRKSKSLHGASTLSQQVAKNVFLWQGRSWFRKGLEVYFTFMIELLWSKKRILEVYLNTVEMGKGIFGIQAASMQYYKKSAKRLTRNEAACIAAALPNPKVYRVNPPSRYVSVRCNWIVRQMYNLQNDPDIQSLLQ